MKVVIAGGSGHLGRVLLSFFRARGDDVVVLSRRGDSEGQVQWDGRTLGAWCAEIDGADVVVNLAGRSVNCRYTELNLAEMMNSRVESTRVIGQAIERSKKPPSVWLQMSTATIYSHRFDAPNDELTGIIGGDEPGAPAYWKRSIEIASAWEEALDCARVPNTRRVALRTAMVMSNLQSGPFEVLSRLARLGLGGPIAGGDQFVSWLHERDFCHACAFIIERSDLEGRVNLAAPNPLPQRDFMAALRRALGAHVGLPAARWMVHIGAALLRNDPELILKSRRVVPARLLLAGFGFEFPHWQAAAEDLVGRSTSS